MLKSVILTTEGILTCTGYAVNYTNRSSKPDSCLFQDVAKASDAAIRLHGIVEPLYSFKPYEEQSSNECPAKVSANYAGEGNVQNKSSGCDCDCGGCDVAGS